MVQGHQSGRRIGTAPPRPAPSGNCLSMWISTPTRTPDSCCSRRAARTVRSCSADTSRVRRHRVIRVSSRCLNVSVSAKSMIENRLQQMIAVGAPSDDMQKQIELGGAGQESDGMNDEQARRCYATASYRSPA